MQLPI